MAETTPNLWPQIEVKPGNTPLGILRQQASLLGSRTNNLLEGQVTTQNVGGRFVHTLSVVAPSLDYFSSEILVVCHEATALFPAFVGKLGEVVMEDLQEDHGIGATRAVLAQPPFPEPAVEVGDQQGLLLVLRYALSSDRTTKVLEALLTQSQSPDDYPTGQPADPFGDQ